MGDSLIPKGGMPTQYTLHQNNKKALLGQKSLKPNLAPSLCLVLCLIVSFFGMVVSFDLLAMIIALMSAPGASEKITAAAQIRLALRQVVQEVESRFALVAGDNEIPGTRHKRKQGEASFEDCLSVL